MRRPQSRVTAQIIIMLASILISGDLFSQQTEPKVPETTRVDAFGDPLPPGVVARLGTLRFREPQGISVVAFSPDLDLVATAHYEDSTVTLWNGNTGEALREVDLGGSNAESVAFLPGGDRVAVGAGSTIFIYPLDGEGDPERIPVPASGDQRFMGGLTNVRHLTCSPEGKTFVSASPWGAIHVWDLQSGERIRTIAGKVGWMSSLAISGDGKVLVAGCEEMKIRAWEIETGKEILEIEVPPPPKNPHFGGGEPHLGPIAISPDGKVIANAGTRTLPSQGPVYLWDAATGKKAKDVGNATYGFTSAEFSPDGKRIAIGSYNQIQVWDWQQEKLLRTLSAGPSGHLAFSRDGKRLASTGEYTGPIQIWDLVTGKKVPDLHSHDGYIDAVAYSPDGKTIASAGVNGEIILWEAPKGRWIQKIQGSPAHERRLQYTGDGKKVAAHGWDNQLVLWDVSTGEEVLNVPVMLQGRFPFVSVQIEGFGEIPKDLLEKMTQANRAFTLSPDGGSVALGDSRGRIKIRDLGSGKEIREISVHESAVAGMAFLGGGKRIISCDTDGSLSIRELESGKEVGRGKLSGGDVRCAIISSDDKTLACGVGDGKIYLWDIPSGEERHVLEGHQWGVAQMWFSPGGELLLSRGLDPHMAPDDKKPGDVIGKYARFLLWDVELGRVVLNLKAFSGWSSSDMDAEGVYHSVVFGPDGHTLAGGSRANVVDLIEIATGEAYRSLSGHRSTVQQVALSPDGRFLVSGSHDTTALLWDLALSDEAPPPGDEKIDMGALWDTLAEKDAPAAYRAVERLASLGDEAVQFIRPRLPRAEEKNREKIEKLVAQLDSEEFGKREEASVGLEPMAEEAAPALKIALSKTESPEVRQRIRVLLQASGPPYDTFPSRNLQAMRAIRVAERIGTPAARAFLEELAAGATWSIHTQRAASALRRMGASSEAEEGRREF